MQSKSKERARVHVSKARFSGYSLALLSQSLCTACVYACVYGTRTKVCVVFQSLLLFFSFYSLILSNQLRCNRFPAHLM